MSVLKELHSHCGLMIADCGFRAARRIRNPQSKIRNRLAAIVILVTLAASWGSAGAGEDQFTLDLGASGEFLRGTGTGFSQGTWYDYPRTGQLVQWFYDGNMDPDGRKVVEVDVTVRVLDSQASGSIEVSLNWTKQTWANGQGAPPLPDSKNPGAELQYISETLLFPRTDVRQSMFMTTSFEIQEFCPEWISIDIRGQNVSIEGKIRHECTTKTDFVPPTDDRDFGDAPEGVVAYPSLGVRGLFPTCVGVGPAAWIEHASTGNLYFGPKVDRERDGNAGKCPTFTPDTYNADEGMQDGDAGLITPRAYTIKGAVGHEEVRALIFSSLEAMGSACYLAQWGVAIDIEVHNNTRAVAYFNLLMDWNHDGKWEKSSFCNQTIEVPEHVVVNFPVPAGYNGPLSALVPPDFQMGPEGGYVWARFTLSERTVPKEWNGDGVFQDGETEDYLLLVRPPVFICDWQIGDPHVMHWAQLPDQQATGIDVAMFWNSLADDFQCTQSGPITDIHFWGSFKDDIRPELGIDSLTFEVNIYANKPADNLIPWSRPGDLLWTKQVRRYSYDFSEVTNNILEGWFEPSSKEYEPDNHKRTYQYDICFDPNDKPFVQKRGEIYWLEIKWLPEEDAKYTFGWKTTRSDLQYSDTAMWFHPKTGWLPMAYPDGHKYEGKRMDLAFVVTGEPPEDTDFGDAPDPTYSTQLVSNGARHTIVPGVYLGRYVDGEADGQPNATATGDDNAGTNDEDGVVFTTALVPGERATITVTASVQGLLNAWFDWNADGDWDDRGEQVFDDITLASGANTLSIDVPIDAVAGQTFARFRFSRMRGLEYDGPATDGEVEDYQVEIRGLAPHVKPPLEHLKWSQPPLETDPTLVAPTFCGWDEPAYASRTQVLVTPTWKFVADDFRCAGNMPVTSVHWWGSYQNWQGQDVPRVQPDSWRVAFWTNVAADSRYRFSRPGRLLWVVSVPAGRVEEEVAGNGQFPQRSPDTTFQYLLKLQPQEYFLQNRYLADTYDSVFWISISAVYTGYPGPQNPWGWKTRPRTWMDTAVKAEFRRDDLRAGFSLDADTAQPLTNSQLCQQLQNYDMAFELDTNPEFIKWEQAFGGLRHWEYYEDEESDATEGPSPASKWTQAPDTTTTGVDVDMTSDVPPTWPPTICADDFECRTTGPITSITLWASWYHDIVAGGSADNATFTLSIRQDVPAGRSPTGFSMPGSVLWRKEFKKGQFTVEPVTGKAESYYSPANETFELNNHLMIYKYTFKIDASEAFQQTGTENNPVVYWLAAQAFLIHSPGSVATRLGWKTSTSHWNDAASWVRADEAYDGSAWAPLQYPKAHTQGGRPIDLAFAIETQRPGTGATYRRLVADDWRCGNGLPVAGIVWWGSYIGYEYAPCACLSTAEPRQPDYFLLSIWSDVPDPDLNNPRDYSHPGHKLWEYKAEKFDEVLVGFDSHRELSSSSVRGFEPVYRYTVRVPEQSRFRQDGQNNVLWLSVVAVYKDSKTINYSWGWTNHPLAAWDLSNLTPLGYWKLDEALGAVAADSSGNGNDGTLMGRPVWKPTGGWMGGALDLNGRGDYIRVERPKGFNFAPNSFSASAWVYPREPRGRWQAIMEYDRDSVSGNRFGLWLDNEGRFHFRVGQNTWHSAQSLAANQWYHLVATFDTTTKAMKLYVDGALDGTATYQKGFVTPTAAMLTLGVRGSEDDEFFNGLLDDVRVYGAALTAEDVLMLSGAGRNDGAVMGQLNTSTDAWTWTQLLDPTGAIEDMSFMLFTEPATATAAQPAEDTNDTGEIIFYDQKK